MFLRVAAAVLASVCADVAMAAADLLSAAREGDMAQVRSLVRDRSLASVAEADGTTPLMWVVRRDDVKAARALLRAGAAVDAVNVNGVTALHVACANASVPMIRLLLDARADKERPDAAGETPLMTAVRAGEEAAVRLLLERGAQADAREPQFDQTVLMLAVRGGQSAIVELLLRSGASVDARTRVGPEPRFRPPGDGSGSHGKGIVRGGWPERGARNPRPGGMTALLYAARDGHAEAARQLLAAGARADVGDANDIRPLVMALTNNQLEVARLLIDAGADVNAMDWYGRAPLWSAIDVRNLEVSGNTRQNGVDRAAALALIDELLRRGADPNARIREVPFARRHIMPLGSLSWVDFTGETPFIRAALAGDVTVMQRLLAKGADPRIGTYQGTTALMAAAGINWVFNQTYDEGPEQLLAAVKLCVEAGLDVNAHNSMGLQAIHGAANRGSEAIVSYLAARGARLDKPDSEGRTPVDWARGVFLATTPPEAKPGTIALLESLKTAR